MQRRVAILCVLVPALCWADAESPTLAHFAPAVDLSVERALQFLAKQQERDGSFPRTTDSKGAVTGVDGKFNAVAGLVGMAFLAKGYTPGRPPYGETINRCVDYILSTSTTNGYLGVRGDRMYGHGISTLFLSEVTGMVDPERQKRVDPVLARAVRIILDAQKAPKTPGIGGQPGGWRYEPTSTDSDISMTGWCVMALRSMREMGAPVPLDAIDAARGYLNQCRNPDGGFAYQPKWWYSRRGYWVGGDSGVGRTGIGLLCMELLGEHDSEANRKSAAYILRSIAPGGFISDPMAEYATYYCSLATFQLGGEYWEKFGEAMYTWVLSIQDVDGAWRTTNGAVYPTAMYVLALSVGYRQLPIYQR